MSFILDQLKKSGKQRKLELAMRSMAEIRKREIAGASRTDFQSTSGHRIHPQVIYLLLLLAAVSFSVLGGFILLHRNSERQSPAASSKAQVYTVRPSMPKAESDRPESALPTHEETSVTTKSGSKADSAEAIDSAADIKIPDDKIKSPVPMQTAEPGNQPESAVQGQIAGSSPLEKPEPQDDAQRTPYLNELPASLKNALPPIRITSHLYRGDSRLVSINGRIMSEGVNMGDGLFLEEITPEGVIMSFHGQRFRLKAD
jgi:hypothetical protein